MFFDTEYDEEYQDWSISSLGPSSVSAFFLVPGITMWEGGQGMLFNFSFFEHMYL